MPLTTPQAIITLALKAAGVLGAEKMYKYMRLFGFYEKTGIDLPGEVVGMNRPLSGWTSSSMYAIPMGQEVTSTAIQLARAISVIADNGFLVRPRIVKQIVDDTGEVVKEFPPQVTRKVISPKTAAIMRGILMGVVETGTGQKARMEEFSAGGKTGTAQKVDPGGTYSHSRFMAVRPSRLVGVGQVGPAIGIAAVQGRVVQGPGRGLEAPAAFEHEGQRLGLGVGHGHGVEHGHR